MKRVRHAAAVVAAVVLAGAVAHALLANGGPFVVKYPGGDPAAKGILARLDPDLRPARETRLRVVKEDLKIILGADSPIGGPAAGGPPLATVSAAYTIENPTDEEIAVDFGFPILRGVYMSPFAMGPTPDVTVRLGSKYVHPTIITNSHIYGIVRQRAREMIEQAVAARAELAKLVAAVRQASEAERDAPREALRAHLAGPMKWNERDAALLLEYAGLDLGKTDVPARDRSPFWGSSPDASRDLVRGNLGPLAAIGEQKATQCLAHLASCFDPKAAAGYEAIFTAWGGDVRERALDLTSGRLRPREFSVAALTPDAIRVVRDYGDPTIYARVDYFDESAKITEAQKAACKTILKNLPVIFTFAPMNLIHYPAKFPPRSTEVLTVSYRQYAFKDTAEPASYQLAYVVHPASMWDTFGPINLEVLVPAGAAVRASVPFQRAEGVVRLPLRGLAGPLDVGKAQASRTREPSIECAVYKATLREKTGELVVAVAAAEWGKAVQAAALAAAPKPAPQQALKE